MGITIEGNSGYVPEYEAREAARFVVCDWEHWQSLHYTERAKAVAHYRLHHAIERHVQKAIEDYHRRHSG